MVKRRNQKKMVHIWVLVCMDNVLSCSLGWPRAIHDEDFDVDYPLEIDDKYQKNPDPKLRFKQPPGKPSLITDSIYMSSLTNYFQA
ncbi:hypothetical protein AX14_008808 [Amanita brunnescens Koide BX004]|nr:hypothetical protein AX14_008808 [Amanita brunnescens Koide BX004]